MTLLVLTSLVVFAPGDAPAGLDAEPTTEVAAPQDHPEKSTGEHPAHGHESREHGAHDHSDHVHHLQGGSTADAIGAIIRAANPKLVVEDTNDPAYLIGKELRCPVCQGMPIADSPADMAQDMMKKVRAMHQAGKTREEILDFFVKSYGEWVLLRPKTEGANWMLWGLPAVAALFALVLMWQMWRKPASTASPGPTVPPTEDEYLAQVREEVHR